MSLKDKQDFSSRVIDSPEYWIGLSELHLYGHTAVSNLAQDQTVPEKPDEIVIEPVTNARGRARFVDLARKFSAREPHSVPQLRSEQMELVSPATTPFFRPHTAQLFPHRQGRDLWGRLTTTTAQP